MNIFLRGGGWGYHKIGLFRGHFICILGSFLKVKVQNGGFLLGLVKFLMFLGSEQ